MARRTGFLVLVAAGGLLPGCATPSRGKPAEAEVVAVPAGPPAVPAKGTEFGVLPRVPGERVARHPAAEPPKTMASVPTPAIKPETVPVKVVAPPPDAPLVAAVKAYLDGRPEVAADYLKALDRPNQELVLQLLPPVVALSQLDLARVGPVEIGRQAAQIETPFRALSAKAPLKISKAEFCSLPSGFGQYLPMPKPPVYPPGDIAEIYVEVLNVPAVPARLRGGDDGFLTHLDTALRLRDQSGRAVDFVGEDRQPVPALHSTHKDLSRSPVRDYWKVFRIRVPRKPGGYTLTVEFSDPKTGRVVSQGMPFDVGGS